MLFDFRIFEHSSFIAHPGAQDRKWQGGQPPSGMLGH